MKYGNLRLPSAFLMAMAFLFLAASQASAQTNMAGSWSMEVSTDQGVTTPSLTLVQDGMKLTGQYSSSTLGNSNVTGTVDGNNVTVSFQADMQGQTASVVYKGSVNEQGVWSGTIDIAGGMLTGTFKGTKK